jgi:long-chain acyl-CoA synthetase
MQGGGDLLSVKEKPWVKNYDPGVDLSPVYTTLTLKEQFIAQVKKSPDKPYIYFLDRVITYREMNNAACKLANALKKDGIKKGDRIAVTLPNSPEFVIAVQACIKIGAIVVPTNPRYTKRELVYQYKDSGAETVICLSQFADINIEILEENLAFLKKIIVIPEIAANRKGTKGLVSYEEFVHNSVDCEPEVDISLEDIVLLMYTGGTTGISKGCSISNKNLIAVASGWKQMCQYFADVDNYKVLCSTPMYHVHGFQTTINANILLGGSMIILPEITTDNIINAINQHEPNVWPAVPIQIKSIVCHPNLRNSKINKIQHIGCGSAPLPVDVIRYFENIVSVPIIEGYGATETSMAVASNPMRKRKIGSVGIPYPNVDFKVVDLKTGDIELPVGEVGELCFKGPQVISEYWRHPVETALAFKDGWWYSGDVGYMDEDGFIFILDRKKDMIICSGFNVYSNEVDSILNSHPKIKEAAVVGVPDYIRGETVKAYVVVKDGERLSDKDIKEYCRQYLAAYKVPKIVEFVDHLPKTSVGKIDRKTLRLRQPLAKDI